MLYELALMVCGLNETDSNCRAKPIIIQLGSIPDCQVRGVIQAALWKDNHPEYRIAGWKCRR